MAGLSQAHLASGAIEQALRFAREARGLADAMGAQGFSAWSRWILAEVATAGDVRVEEAQRLYEEALALGERLRMRPLMACCHLGLGVLWRRHRRPEHARAPLGTSLDLFRKMEMSFWTARAQSELVMLG